MKENYCYLIDSGLDFYKIKQDKIQELFNNKTLTKEDITEHLGCEDITDLIENLLVNFKLYNKYYIQYIIYNLNDLLIELD